MKARRAPVAEWARPAGRVGPTAALVTQMEALEITGGCRAGQV
jgi:hypothetical protein